MGILQESELLQQVLSSEKKCIKCGLVQISKNFYKDKLKKDGLYSNCKKCFNLIQKKYRDSTKGKNTMKKWRIDNRLLDKKNHAYYYQEHREILDSKNKKWYLDNLEERRKYVNEYAKKYRLSSLVKKKQNARQLVKYYRKIGKIKIEHCSYPNGQCYGRMEAHHWDYDKPLEIIGFCRKHHEMADRVQKFIQV